MGETDLQLGGGYTYQWECAILLALNYFSEPVRYNPTLDDLVTGFLGEVAEIHLEGKDQDSGVDLEDIGLVRGSRRILIQVKTKQADWGQWTPTEPLLLKSLCRFYDSHFFLTQPENTRFVFLTNRAFNRDLVQVQTAIREGAVTLCPEVDQLCRHLEVYARKEKGTALDPARFREMLVRTALVEYLGVDEVKANVQAKLQAYGRRDWQQAHSVLFEYFTRQSTRIGGGAVTQESLGHVLGPSIRVETDAEIEARYRQQVARAYGHLTLRGYPERDPDLSPPPLERIFIKLSATTRGGSAPDLLPSRRMRELEELREWLLGGKGRALKGERFVFDGRDLSEAELKELLHRYEQEMEERRKPQPVTLSVPEALRDHDRLVITGPPGSGKSTLLRWLALTFAGGKQALPDRLGEAYPHGRLPVVVELRNFQGCFSGERERLSTVNLADEIAAFVAEDARFEGTPASFVRQALANGDCLVAFDGLDEIGDFDARQRATAALQAFADNYATRGNRIIVTTRPAGYRGVELASGFQHCEINPFSPEDISQFIHHWYEVAYLVDPTLAREDAVKLVQAIQDSDRVSRLAETPLLCTIIAIVYRKDRILPNRRVDLYLKCCEALLDTWERTKEIRQSGLIGGLDWQTKLDLLSPLAYWLHSENGRTAASEGEFETRLAAELRQRRLCEEPKAEQEARAFLAAIHERSGLLQGRGDGTLEFPHLTFQEYLAARYIAAQPDPDYIDLFMPHLHDTWWREVHLLTIGHLGAGRDGAPKASRLLESVLNRYRPPARWLQAMPYPDSRLTRSRYLPIQLVGEMSEWVRTLPACALPSLQLVRRLAWALQRELLFAAVALADCVPSGVMHTVRDRIGTALKEVLLLAVSEAPWIGHDTPWLAAASSLGQLGQATPDVIAALVGALGDSDSHVRQAAASSLGHLGQATPEAVATLISILGANQWYVRKAAARSLVQLGQGMPEVVVALVGALGNSDWHIRAEAADSLDQIAQATPEVVAALFGALGDSNWYVRRAAVRGLGQLAPATPEVVVALIGALGDSGPEIQEAAATSLGELRQATPEALAALVGALGNSNSKIRAAAASSLGQLGQATAEVAAALVNALRDDNWQVRETVASSLGQLGQATPEGTAGLASTLVDRDWRVRGAAVSSLAQLGEVTTEVITAQVNALKDSNAKTRQAAASNLGILGQPTPEVVAALVSALGDSDEYVKTSAAQSLGQLGQATPEVAAALINVLGDMSSLVVEAATGSLVQLGQATSEAAAVLISALEDSGECVQRTAAQSLGQLGQATPEVVETLVSALRARDIYVRAAATRSLGQLGQATPEVVAALVGALRDRKSDHFGNRIVSKAAACSLGQLGQATPEVMAALVGALGDSEGDVRKVAARSLGQLGQVTPEVVVALNRNLHHSDEDVRSVTHEALSKLLDGKALPGDKWVPLKERQKPQRNLRRALLLLFALAAVLLPLAYLLAALYVPWVHDNLWLLSLLLADFAVWIAFLANVGKIRETLGDLWR